MAAKCRRQASHSLKPTILLCRSLTEHSQCARVQGDDCAKLYFDRNEAVP